MTAKKAVQNPPRSERVVAKPAWTLLVGKGLPGFNKGQYAKVPALRYVDVIRAGVQSDSFDQVADYVELTKNEMARLLHIDERTLARRKNKTLTREETEKLVRVARVVDRASEVCGSKDKGVKWLKIPNDSLDGTPISYLDTDVGAESVLDTLGRIEHGVFA